MQTSVIRHRVADFLKRFAPFDAFTEEDLLDLAGSGKVKFHESEEYIFRQGDAEGPLVWIIQQGRVELLEGDSGEQLRDVVGEGDLLGLDRFFGDGRCRHSARTASDLGPIPRRASGSPRVCPLCRQVSIILLSHAL